jgi:heparin lyase
MLCDGIIDYHIVNNKKVSIGNNNEKGAYFKFGIYRVGNSTVPVSYNLAGYKEFAPPIIR